VFLRKRGGLKSEAVQLIISHGCLTGTKTQGSEASYMASQKVW